MGFTVRVRRTKIRRSVDDDLEYSDVPSSDSSFCSSEKSLTPGEEKKVSRTDEKTRLVSCLPLRTTHIQVESIGERSNEGVGDPLDASQNVGFQTWDLHGIGEISFQRSSGDFDERERWEGDGSGSNEGRGRIEKQSKSYLRWKP